MYVSYSKNELILGMYVHSRINNNLIAGCFSPIGLRQLRAVPQFCLQLTKAYDAKTSCNQVVIDSATYLLKISSSSFKVSMLSTCPCIRGVPKWCGPLYLDTPTLHCTERRHIPDITSYVPSIHLCAPCSPICAYKALYSMPNLEKHFCALVSVIKHLCNSIGHHFLCFSARHAIVFTVLIGCS